MTEEDVFLFVRSTIRSVWALELLILLHKNKERSWSTADLVRELRSSDTIIVPCLDGLKSAGLIGGGTDTGFRYAPADDNLNALCDELAKIYATRPMALAKTIMKTPNEKLLIFSNAFKLKD